jgi:hypothetical protein
LGLAGASISPDKITCSCRSPILRGTACPHRKKKKEKIINAHFTPYLPPPQTARHSHTRRSTPLAPHRPRLRPSLPFLSLSATLPTWPKARPPPTLRTAGPAVPQPCGAAPHGVAARAARLHSTLPRCSFHQIHCAARDPMVVGTPAPAAGAACRAQNTSGQEEVAASLVVGGVHLVASGDSAAASSELHTPASLHFASNKEMLRCAENVCCKRMFQVF